MKKLLYLLLVFTLLIFAANNLSAGAKKDKDNGIIYGKAIDKQTQKGIENAVIKIINSNIQTLTDANGDFRFENLKYATYVLETTVLGYTPFKKTDIVVESEKPVSVLFQLNSTEITTENIEVESNFYQKSADVNLSSLNLDYEEVRRAPGAVEDISRMLQTAPGVSIENDQRNDLIVRGGSPTENLFLIDGIEIPNINHYATQGSTGGPIGFINLKFIREADIYTGGFTSKYGDKLSSVVDIKFREGSRENYINNVDLSFAGFGGIFEGPITKKSSYLLSIRRSYLDLLKGAIRLSTIPNYWDFNLKLNYKFNDNNSLSLIGFSALDKINFKVDESSSVNDDPYNTNDNTDTYTLGLNYKKLFRNGYMQAVVSNTYTKYDADVYYAPTGQLQYYTHSFENESTYKFDLNYKLNNIMYLNFNAGGKYATFRNNIFGISDTIAEGYVLPEILIDNKISTNKLLRVYPFPQNFFPKNLH